MADDGNNSEKKDKSSNEPIKQLTMTEDCKETEYGDIYWDNTHEIVRNDDPSIVPKFILDSKKAT